MEHELTWGFPVIWYLFLAGLGAGALVTSCSLLLRGNNRASYFRYARYGAVLSLPTVAIGVALLVLELGSFQSGHWFRWINLYKTINLSPMSIGSWFLVIYFLVSAPYVLTFLVPNSHSTDRYARVRTFLAYPCIALGIGVAVYTGILLGAMPSRPLWNSPILAMLFLISAISTGIAAVLLSEWISDKIGTAKWCADKFGWDKDRDKSDHTDAAYILAATDAIFISFEILVIFLYYMYAHLTVGNVEMAIKVFEPGGELAGFLWFGVVGLGLLVPLLIESKNILPKLLGRGTYSHSGMMVFTIPILVIAGGFFLRYVIVIGGQIAKLAGI
ncbi:NrfD protein [hydrothermal vent metagenome]|uniref:NrfD protein n=1 Tax=hydrothermal vent metagenome TaxID=652676 RepID=A0A3B0SAV5_9ZZZZ